MIRVALYGVQEIIAETMKVLDRDDVHNPSFTKYFNSEEIDTVQAVFALLAGYVGAPYPDRIRECFWVDFFHVFLVDGDQPDMNLNTCAESGQPHAQHLTLTGHDGKITGIIVFCEKYWTEVYKLHKELPQMPGYRHVHRGWVGPHIDTRGPSGGYATESGASILLHGEFVRTC